MEILHGAGWRSTCRDLSHTQRPLAMSKLVARRCKGGRQGRGKGVSDGPVNGKTSSEPSKLGMRSSSPPGGSQHLWLFSSVERTICSPVDICSGAIIGDGALRSWESCIYFIATCCGRRTSVFTLRRVIFYASSPRGRKSTLPLCILRGRNHRSAQEVATVMCLESDRQRHKLQNCAH